MCEILFLLSQLVSPFLAVEQVVSIAENDNEQR